MPAQPTSLSAVAVAVTLSGLIFDSKVAEVVGPYAVICLGAVLGGAVSASRRGSSTRLGTLGYMALVIVFALLVTVPLAEVVADHIPGANVEPSDLFAVVAAVVAGIGHDWPNVGLWFINLARGMAERWANSKQPPPPGGPNP